MSTAGRELPNSVAGAASSEVATLPFLCLAAFTAIVVAERGSLAWVLIALTLTGLVLRSRALRFPAPLWWSSAFLGWALLGSFAAMSTQLVHEALLERLKTTLIFLAVVNVLQTKQQLRVYLLIVLAAFMVYPVRGSLLNYLHGYTLFGRAIWNQMYQNPNYLAGAALLVIGVALSFVTAKAETRVVRVGTSVCAAALVLVVLLTQSRGAFLGLVAGLGLPAAQRMLKRWSTVLYALVLVVIGANLVPQTVWHRLGGISKLTSTATVAQADLEGSAAQRLEIQKVAWRVFADHPILGVGLGCYPVANARYSPGLGSRDTHNTYLNIAAEVGIPGLVLWLGMVVSVLRYAKRYRASAAAAGLSMQTVWTERALLGFLIAGLFSTFSRITILYLVLGALWCAARISEDASSAPVPGRGAGGAGMR
jgi:putative inorganic carbon (HCO3(-)) transporter